jgi:hypothetical protein
MNNKLMAAVLILAAAAALPGWRDSEAHEPWNKFVVEPGQTWLTNGVCKVDEDDHWKTAHAYSKWDQTQVRIIAVPGQGFRVTVVPKGPPTLGFKDKWDTTTFQYIPGNDTSATEFPASECGEDSAKPETPSDISDIEHLAGTVSLHHNNGQTQLHEVSISLWKQAEGAGGTKYGPLKIAIKHAPTDTSHNGIVH